MSEPPWPCRCPRTGRSEASGGPGRPGRPPGPPRPRGWLCCRTPGRPARSLGQARGGVGVGTDDRGVDRDFLAQAGLQFGQPVGQGRHALIDKIAVKGQPVDEPVEGGPVRQLAEPAEQPEFRVVLEPADQRVGAGQPQNEGREVGPPEGGRRVAFPPNRAVLLQPGDQRGHINFVKDGPEFVEPDRILRIGVCFSKLCGDYRGGLASGQRVATHLQAPSRLMKGQSPEMQSGVHQNPQR